MYVTSLRSINDVYQRRVRLVPRLQYTFFRAIIYLYVKKTVQFIYSVRVTSWL